MFSYYGSKSKIVSYYPYPKYNLIIEPFAGAAWYSFIHAYKNVLLNEKNDTVFGVLHWIINEARKEQILNNKDFYLNQDISILDLPQPQKDLIGFCINRGVSSPCNIVQKWSCQVAKNPTWASTTSYQLKRIANALPYFKNWQVMHGDYKDLPDIEATYFIDPPYQYGGQYYAENKIDYNELAEWCKRRKGQVIVCENSKAKWLPFEPLIKLQGQKQKTVEVIWTNNNNLQSKLF